MELYPIFCFRLFKTQIIAPTIIIINPISSKAKPANIAIAKKIFEETYNGLKRASLTNAFTSKGIVKVDSLPEKQQIRILKELFGKDIAEQAIDRKIVTQISDGDFKNTKKFYSSYF